VSANNWKDIKGVTLIEVMIALVVLLIVFLGLLQASILGIENNLRNQIRDEAVNIAAERVNEARSMVFDDLVDDTADTIADNTVTPPTLASCPENPYPVLIDRNIRNMTFPYGTMRDVTDLEVPPAPINTKQIEILVRWQQRNECFTYRLTTLRRR